MKNLRKILTNQIASDRNLSINIIHAFTDLNVSEIIKIPAKKMPLDESELTRLIVIISANNVVVKCFVSSFWFDFLHFYF